MAMETLYSLRKIEDLMKYLRIFILYSIFFTFSSTSYSFNLNKVYNVKTFSSVELEVNETNLVEKENAEKLLSSINDANEALTERSKIISKKNKNRKKQKYKGGVEIYEDYSESVVFIGNRDKGKIKTVGSGFVINSNIASAFGPCCTS